MMCNNKPKFKLKSSIGWLGFLLLCYSLTAFAAATLNISQIPLLAASPQHPQVLILIGNSQSMDGTLNGAIMTGSGSRGLLNNSSSPVNYNVPSGFTPPKQAANASNQAPYTVNQSSVLYDNSASRLNVAKQAVLGILQAYMSSTDFGLATYNTGTATTYNTMVYYMSVSGSNFTFTNSNSNTSNRYVNNPCYNYPSAASPINTNCASIATLYGTSTLQNNQYMQIGASSDDSTINDVLYIGGGFPSVFTTYSGPNPTTPYPPNYSLANYNQGSVSVRYNSSQPNIGAFSTSPTNAGYVPFSPQVMYALRGFGFYSTQSANTGTVRVPMTTAGTNPTQSSVTTAINTFVPLLNPETNSASTPEIKASATQSPMAGLLRQASTYMGALQTTSGSGCAQKKYVILITDGLPTQSLNGQLWPPLGSAAAAGYGVTVSFNSDGSLRSTNNQALTDAINQITALKNNGINTYVIGLGAGVNPNLNPQAAASLTAMAIAGGTIGYYPATSVTALVNNLNNILISIQSGSFSVSSATVNTTFLNTDTVEYKGSYVSQDTPYFDWTGNLEAIRLNAVTGLPTSTVLWSAQTMLDTLVAGTGWQNARFIATWDAVNNVGIPFQFASLNTTQRNLLRFGATNSQTTVQYIRGNTALEQRNGGTLRNRSHILGDIVDSQAAYVGPPNGTNLSSSYLAFARAQINRTPMVYVGANDGMLHAFNASTGQEAFAFIPNAMFPILYNLASPLYNQSHLFFVDGSPVSGDVQFSNGTWHTLVVGGENAGGRSVYALDVTNPSSLSNETALASAVLWEFTDSDMGLSYSQPQMAQINGTSTTASTFAVFFGNGYNSPNNNSVLYAINPQTGAVLSKINLCTSFPSACNANEPQGLSSVSVGQQDGIQNQPITNVYAGDLQGNLWSVNVSSANPSSWTVRLLFQARTATGAAQPITTAPVITLNPNYPRYQGLFVLFGTGQILTSNDLLTTQTQSIYGVWDKLAVSTTYARANLQSQTLNSVSAATSGFTSSILTATTSTVNWITSNGWYADLPIAGQRSVTNASLVNGSYINTLNTPPLSTCGSGFSSMLLDINYATGGAFTTGQLDINNDGVINSADTYSGGFAVGVGLANSYAAAPTVLGTNSDNNTVLLITLSNGTQLSVFNPNNNPRRAGWWEIQ